MRPGAETLTDGFLKKELIQKAWDFAEFHHRGQKRRDNKDFITHPFRVALELKNWGMDEVVVSCGLLHDLVEDTDVEVKDIEKEFGGEIASICQALTKIKKIVPDEVSTDVENMRQLIVAMSSDVRVIIIRLADKLDNMRTIKFLDGEAQKKFSRSVLEVYAPIAHRFGMYRIKTELEDRAFEVLEKEKYTNINKFVNRLHPNAIKTIENVKKTLEDSFKAKGIAVLSIYGRVKSPISIYRKSTIRGVPLEKIEDIVAVRIIVATLEDCYKALAVLYETFEPKEGTFTDYISYPKINMYQSIHTTCVVGKEPVEFQIRTEEMHKTAEMGIAAHWKYKESRGKEASGLAVWLESFYEWQKEKISHEDFIKNLRMELSYDEVYVITPAGDVKRLIKSATPLDFAYAVHTEVGNHFRGALVNGKMVPMTYVLKNGDRVKILTSKSAHPTVDWLKVAKMPSARYKIRKFLREKSEKSASPVKTGL